MLYLDPEWGGPAYHNEAQVHLSLQSHGNTVECDTDLVTCVAHALAAGPRLRAVVLKLPTNVSSVQWQGLHALPGVRARAFDECMHGHVGFGTLVLVRDTWRLLGPVFRIQHSYLPMSIKNKHTRTCARAPSTTPARDAARASRRRGALCQHAGLCVQYARAPAGAAAAAGAGAS